MSLKKIIALIFAALLSVGIATAAYAAGSQPTGAVTNYCVTFGHGPTAAGNVVEFNWDGSQCPPGTYNHEVSGTSVTTGTDNDPYLPQDGFAFFAQSDPANTAFPATVFTIVDDTNVPSISPTVYHCHFITPTQVGTTAVFTPNIVCTK